MIDLIRQLPCQYDHVARIMCCHDNTHAMVTVNKVKDLLGLQASGSLEIGRLLLQVREIRVSNEV